MSRMLTTTGTAYCHPFYSCIIVSTFLLISHLDKLRLLGTCCCVLAHIISCYTCERATDASHLSATKIGKLDQVDFVCKNYFVLLQNSNVSLSDMLNGISSSQGEEYQGSILEQYYGCK